MRLSAIRNLLATALTITTLSLLLSGCKDEEELRPKTISDIIQQDDRFTILRAVLKQGGMSDALRTGSFTFFAPDDNAFRKMSITEPGQASSLTRDSLRSVIQYLVLEGIHPSSEFEGGNKKPIVAFDRNTLLVTKDAGRFMVNMANVTAADLKADNGLIHVLDHVPSTSPMTISQWVAANPSFSFLAAMARKAAGADPDLAALLLSENSAFTLFAPSNEAFISSGFEKIEDIETAEPIVLASILSAHILRNAYFTTEFKTGQVGSIGNHSLLIAVNDKITVAAEHNSGTLPTITRSDILTKNGVIHVLDKVLIP